MQLRNWYLDCQNKRGDVVSALGLVKRAAPTWGRELVWPPELATIDIVLTQLGAHSIAASVGLSRTIFEIILGAFGALAGSGNEEMFIFEPTWSSMEQHKVSVSFDVFRRLG